MTRDELLEQLTLERFTRHQPAPTTGRQTLRADDLACAARRRELMRAVDFEDELKVQQEGA